MAVTEPTLPPTPFEPGVDRLQAPFADILDTICYYLRHEDERLRLVANATDFFQAQYLAENRAHILGRLHLQKGG